jgi:phosphoribosyl 1,2-cyclic phosphate phosphodiesterase
MHMKATLLGTGTSSGIPIIGCDCDVCQSPDTRNRRRRTSLHLEAGGLHVLVDTPPDFREQALCYKLPRVDAVLFTHSHADHIFGFDDIRRYNTMQGGAIPAYAETATMQDLRRIFDYISTEKIPGFYRPQIDFLTIDGPFALGELRVTPLPVVHGPRPTLGFLFQSGGSSLAYVPDCKQMPDATMALLEGVDVVILDALRHRDHKTHMTVAESVATLQRIGAPQSYLVHLCHDLDHATLAETLPDGIDVSFDGQVIALTD